MDNVIVNQKFELLICDQKLFSIDQIFMFIFKEDRTF